MSLLALTISAALAQSAPAVIETPRDYVDCLETASKEAALDYEDVGDGVPRVMAACEAIWDRFEQRTLQRHPNDAETLADLKSRMREQVREVYADNSPVLQKRDLLNDLIKSAEEGERRVTVQRLIDWFVECQVTAARSAVERRMEADKIANHVERECKEFDAGVAELLPKVIDESLVAGARASAADVAAYKRKSVQKVLDGMRKSARQAYAPLVQQAKRREICIAEGNDADTCDLYEKASQASAAYQGCVGASARKSANDGDSFDDAVTDIDKTCADEWAAVVELSGNFEDGEAKRTRFLQGLHTALRRDYPEMLEQARNAGGGAE